MKPPSELPEPIQSQANTLAIELCPLCKSNNLVAVEEKMLLGLITAQTLECGCGAVFLASGDGYKLFDASDRSHPIWREYGGQSLTGKEWNNIAHGGLSDPGQREIDLSRCHRLIEIGTTKLDDRALSTQVDRNLLGQKLEKLGREDEAIQLYEQNLLENDEGSHPYDRLAVIYRRRKLYVDEIRVLAHAIWVYENLASKSRMDRIPKLARFKKRLEKAKLLAGRIETTDDSRFTAMCPYCNSQLDKLPKRKKKCPTCGNHIHIRTGQRIFPSILLTEGQADVADHFDDMRYYGVTDMHFIQEEEKLRREFGKDPRPRDTLWSFYNSLMTRLAEEKYISLAPLYHKMALFLYQEGKPFFHFVYQAIESRLLDYQQSSLQDLFPFYYEKVQILTRPDSCSFCRQQNARILTIDDALSEMPIPKKNCIYQLEHDKSGWCRCTYRPLIEER